MISLLKQASYDYEAAETSFSVDAFEAYGCLVNKKAVCDGYSKAFHILTRLMGMKDSIVLANGHTFNIIQINNEWYSFDGTRLEHINNIMTLYKADIYISNSTMFLNNISNNESISISFN